MNMRPGLIVIDTTLPGDILDRVMFPGDRHIPPITVRDHLAEVARMAVLDALPTLPARITDDGHVPPEAPAAATIGCLG